MRAPNRCDLGQAKGRTADLTLPIDGTFQQLAIHTLGGVVTPAQQLMAIVPLKATLKWRLWSPTGTSASSALDNRPRSKSMRSTSHAMAFCPARSCQHRRNQLGGITDGMNVISEHLYPRNKITKRNSIMGGRAGGHEDGRRIDWVPAQLVRMVQACHDLAMARTRLAVTMAPLEQPNSGGRGWHHRLDTGESRLQRGFLGVVERCLQYGTAFTLQTFEHLVRCNLAHENK